ncbi:MAG TPA: enolase C-terminal domain-like protein, partial [Terriglobia bacterium]|nr:enolase C-terminal domain-like protein [Terriglobia bacterium]
TDFPEADGTIEWDSTTIVIVEAHAGGQSGIGYTYGDLSCGRLVDRVLSSLLLGKDAMDVEGRYMSMLRAVRNIGRPGIASHAIAAVDIALWDLKARLLNLPLWILLGGARNGIEVYGSGGFTSYSVEQIQEQFRGWVDRGISKVKMKVGSNPAADLYRVRAAKQAIGGSVELFVDANGAYTRKQALEFAENFAAYDVRWFEEPVSSDDLEGLRLIRDRAPGGMDVAAGEYGYDPTYFQRMLDAQAVDVLQADATRCAGVSGFLQAAALADAHHVPLSAHTAPSIHAHVCCAVPPACHLEYFHDHVRIERMLFDQVLEPINGCLYPDRSRPGLGIQLKRSDAVQYAA